MEDVVTVHIELRGEKPGHPHNPDILPKSPDSRGQRSQDLDTVEDDGLFHQIG